MEDSEAEERWKWDAGTLKMWPTEARPGFVLKFPIQGPISWLLSRSLTHGLAARFIGWQPCVFLAWIVIAIAFPSTITMVFSSFFAARPLPSSSCAPLLSEFQGLGLAINWLIGGGSALYPNVLLGRPSPSFFRRFLQDSFFFWSNVPVGFSSQMSERLLIIYKGSSEVFNKIETL